MAETLDVRTEDVRTDKYTAARYNIEHVSSVRLLARALGVAFFSVLSLAIAFYAFLELPQVQDLLFDVRAYTFQAIIYWAGFYVVGIFIWALPLVFTARLLLMQNFDVIGVDSDRRFRFYIFRLPALLAVFAFLAVLLGIYMAAANLPAPSLNVDVEVQKNLNDHLSRHLITLFLATAGVLILVIVRNFFILGYDRVIARLESRDPEGFKRTLIRIEKLSRKHTQDLDVMDLHLCALKPDFLSDETWITAQRVKVFMWRYLLRISLFLLILVAVHFLSYSEIVQQWVRLPEIAQLPQLEHTLRLLGDTMWMKRAAFLFVVFGAWLPFVSFLALLSNRWQFPFIGAIVAVTILTSWLFGDGHNVRTIDIAKPDQAKLRPVGFADAVDKWKAANGWAQKGCDKEGADLANCPRPIIVSGEGGGSRAAFLIASVLGVLEDESLARGGRPFHTQLFAVSSVSGSSVGAAYFVSALQRHQSVPLDRLKQSLYNQRLWFQNIARAGTGKEKFLDQVVTYKDALQAALSNDFLSPVVIAYLARDTLTLSRLPHVMDRAGVLETAWEAAFDEVWGSSQQPNPLASPHLMTGPDNAWLPLLFMNATSTETGRRIVYTPVKLASAALSDGSALLVDAYDGDSMMCQSALPGSDSACHASKPLSFGVRLSTAAGVSSRSPFVSPHANINNLDGDRVDSGVDGGYFDNSGAVTAFAIAAGLRDVDPKLRPFIIQVSSEPDWFKDSADCGAATDGDLQPEVMARESFQPLGTLGDIFTVNATRVSRGFETIKDLSKQLGRLNDAPGLVSYKGFYVCPQPKENFFYNQYSLLVAKYKEEPRMRSILMKERHRRTRQQTQKQWKSVSLSWWLSPPLQAYLDAQVYAVHNIKSRECVLSLLSDPPAQNHPACN